MFGTSGPVDWWQFNQEAGAWEPDEDKGEEPEQYNTSSVLVLDGNGIQHAENLFNVSHNDFLLDMSLFTRSDPLLHTNAGADDLELNVKVAQTDFSM
jgi:hypothetical protein